MRSMWSLTRLSWFQLDLFPAPAFLLLLCINYSFEIVVILIIDDTLYIWLSSCKLSIMMINTRVQSRACQLG